MRLHYSLLLLLLLGPLTLTAQKEAPSVPEMVKSLETLSERDSLRAKTLLRLAKMVRNEDFEQSVSYNQQAIEAARAANHPTYLCMALSNAATNALVKSDYKQTARFIAEGLKIAETNNIIAQQAWLNRNLSNLYLNTADYERASKYTIISKNIAEKQKDNDLLSLCYSDLGQIALIAKNYSESIRYSQLAIKYIKPEQKNVILYNYVTQIQAYHAIQEYGRIPALLDTTKLLIAQGGAFEYEEWSVWMAESYYLIDAKKDPLAAIRLLESKLNGKSPESLKFWSFNYWERCAVAYSMLKDHKQTIFFGKKALDWAINESKSNLSSLAMAKDFKFAQMVAESYMELGLYNDAQQVHQTIYALQDSVNTYKSVQANNARLVALEIEGHDREWEEKNATLEARNRNLRLVMAFLVPLLLGALLSSYLLQRWRMADKAAQNQKAINIDLESLVKERTSELESAYVAVQATKEREIATLALLNQHHGEFLEQLKQDIKELQKSGEVPKSPAVKTIVTSIEDALKRTEEWGSFMMHFERLHPDFFQKLQAQAPDLTPLDLRHCAYLRLGMSLKQVASILNCSTEAVRQARNRIRRKFGLSPESSLRAHLGAQVDAHADAHLDAHAE